MRYTSSITTGSLKLAESRVIAGLLLRGLEQKDFQQAVSRDNVLQTSSKHTSQSLANLIRRRLQHLDAAMLTLVRDGSLVEATHACLAAADMDVRDDPAVAVLVDLLDFDRLALDQVTEGLPGDVAERLGFLWGVDAVEPDFHLAVLAVDAGERVAVGDRDDLELLGQRLDF